MLDTISQFLIMTFTCTSAFVFSSENNNVRKWAYVVGLLGEPWWFYTSIANAQWGIFVSAVWFTACQFRGLYHHWYKPYKLKKFRNII